MLGVPNTCRKPGPALPGAPLAHRLLHSSHTSINGSFNAATERSLFDAFLTGDRDFHLDEW